MKVKTHKEIARKAANDFWTSLYENERKLLSEQLYTGFFDPSEWVDYYVPEGFWSELRTISMEWNYVR